MAEKKSFVLRIDPKLFEELQRLAEAEFRSVNGQIEYVLHDYVRRRTSKNAIEESEEK